MFNSISHILDNRPVFHDYLLRKCLTLDGAVSAPILTASYRKKWFQEIQVEASSRPDEEVFATNMQRLSMQARNALTVSQLFVPQSTIPIEGVTLDIHLAADLLKYADFAKIFAKLARENSFKEMTGPERQRFENDIFTFSTYFTFTAQELMLRTQMIIKGQVEKTKKFIGRHAGPQAMYAQALENTYDWQMLHGTFVPDITKDDLTADFVQTKHDEVGSEPIEPLVLQVSVRDWLGEQIFHSQLLKDMRAGRLVLPENIQFANMHEFQANTIATYTHGVLLFLYRLTVEYDRIKLESKLNS